ncbi:MAG: lipid-A-disaccharide synthase [Desulfobacterales bacterium]|nr:MAG: lipid-A-disaccharide synthase [Desulfobacterales bacterium]
MNPISNHPCVAIIAGEASGDQHGANLVSAMQRKLPDISFCGIGGPALRQAGVRIVVDAAELTVVGITEVLAKIPTIMKGLASIKRLLKNLKPDLLILIDFPDFNLHVASVARRLGIPVLYYISPQIWAWRQGRVKRIKRRVNHMAVILPFEVQFYREHSVPVTFVGHPLLDTRLPAVEQALKDYNPEKPIIGLVPGSRESEIIRLLPTMLEAADILRQRLKHVTFIISQALTVKRALMDTIIGKFPGWADVEVISDGVEKVFERCDAIIAASGTVTLQAAIHAIPMVIIYKVSPLSAWLARALVRVPHVGLVNLVAGRRLVPELLQHQATGANIARTMEGMLQSADKLNQLKHELIALRDVLGQSGASARVAELALGMIHK